METIYIYVPYIKTEILEQILPTNKSKVIIVTTWDTRDLLTGSSELILYPFCKKNNITLYINNKIHLKVYSAGFKNMILGTGNISHRGLMPDGNYEAAIYVESLLNEDRLFFEKIRAEARLVNDELYQQLLDWYNKQSKLSKQNNQFDHTVRPFTQDNFLISALPMTKNVDTLTNAYENINNNKNPSMDDEITSCVYHDIANYSIELGLTKEVFLSKLKKQFFDHPFIKKIDEFINPEAYFGSIKEWIQNNCTDVPIPSRRELTGNVQVLYEWFEKLGDGKYYIDVPGSHSQRLVKVSQSETEKFQQIPKIVWIGLNEKGKSIDQIEIEKNRKFPGDVDQEEFREKPIWHNKTDLDQFVANKLKLVPDKWGKDKSENLFYRSVVNSISKLREEGKIIDWKHDSDQKLKRTGIWRIR